jgi:hypothetical protein
MESRLDTASHPHGRRAELRRPAALVRRAVRAKPAGLALPLRLALLALPAALSSLVPLSLSSLHRGAAVAGALAVAVGATVGEATAGPPSAADLLETFAAGWKAEDAASIKLLLAAGETRFRLEPPGAADADGPVDAALCSPAQIFYILQKLFAQVRVLDARRDRKLVSPRADQAHGVVEVQWRAAASDEPVRRRLFIEMRHQSEGWRVVEVRALP